MSNNYYLAPEGAEEHVEGIHLGKHVLGREFIFESSPGLESFAQVREALGRGVVRDETGRDVGANAFLEEVSYDTQHGRRYLYADPPPDPNYYRDGEGYLFCRVRGFC